MDNKTNSSNFTPTQAPKQRSHFLSTLLLSLLLLASISLSAATFIKQQSTAKKVADIESKVVSLSTAQTAQNTDAASDEQATLKVAFANAIHYWEYSGAPLSKDTPDLLLVDVTITNSSSNPAKFERSKLLLKDKSDITYPLAMDSSLPGQDSRFESGIIGLPNGSSEIQDQTVPTGETVKGVLVFYTPQELHEYVISYDSAEQSIISKPGEYKYLEDFNN